MLRVNNVHCPSLLPFQNEHSLTEFAYIVTVSISANKDRQEILIENKLSSENWISRKEDNVGYTKHVKNLASVESSLSRQMLFQMSYEQALTFHCIFAYTLEKSQSATSVRYDEHLSWVIKVSRYLVAYPTKITRRKKYFIM